VIGPDDEMQAELVMDAIYGSSGIKAGGGIDRARQRLLVAAGKLAGAGAGVIVTGCTEISLALRGQSAPVPLIDATAVLAEAIVDRALTR
jgi:aspartate racemase